MRIKIILDKSQWDKLSDLSIGLGQLFFVSIVLPYVVPAIDKPPLVVLIFGLVTAFGLWIFAIWIVRKR